MSNRRYKENIEENFDEQLNTDYSDKLRRKSVREEVDDGDEYGDLEEPGYGFTRYMEDLPDNRYEGDDY